MSASPKDEFHMPGAYYDSPPLLCPARALGANIFLPPDTSSPLADSTFNNPNSDSSLAQSTGSLYSDISMITTTTTAKRKRAAQDSRESTPVANEYYGSMSSADIDGAYTIAGQIGISGTCASTMDDSIYSDVDYRRALGPQHSAGEEPSSSYGAMQDVERWNVLHALGNVVGKVWEFCTASAFRGFQAGGGVAYDWETGKPTEQQEQVAAESRTTTEQQKIYTNGEEEEQNSQETVKYRPYSRSPTGLPTTTTGGNFAFDLAGIGAVHRPENRRQSNARSHTPPQRNSKRRQTGPSGAELGRNWVMVDSAQKSPASPKMVTLSRTSSRASSTLKTGATNVGTPNRRVSQYARPTRSSAAAAVTPGTSRRINTPISRIGASTTPSTTTGANSRRQRVSHAGSPSLSSREPASFASPRSSMPLGTRPVTTSLQSPGGGSRIPMPLSGDVQNPFARVTSSSNATSRPSSQAGMRSSTTVGGLQSPGHRRSYSGRVVGGPTRSPGPKKAVDITGEIVESPRLTDEAKRLAAQNRAAERDADAKMETWNMQLQAMIRQGQEALGTTFEVDIDSDGDDGGGGEQDDYWADV